MRSDRSLKRVRRASAAPQGDFMGKGIRETLLFLYATSFPMMVRRGLDAALWAGFLVKNAARFNGSGSGRGAARETRRRLSLGENGARSDAQFPSSNGRSDQLRPTDGCPATGGISPGPLNRRPAAGGPASNSNRRTGPKTEGFINSA